MFSPSVHCARVISQSDLVIDSIGIEQIIDSIGYKRTVGVGAPSTISINS
jgi:hypothetical protein